MAENRYEIIKLLGKGRTGGVYEAEDNHLHRKVAMRRFFDQLNTVDFTEHKERFLEEAQSLSNLQHPNLLRVFDAGVDEDGAYIVSQLLKGESLHEETKKGPIEPHEVVELAKQMLDAFSMAHEIGYYHGALTPDSIFMVPRARGGYTYVILDMGLSRLAPLIQGEDSVLAVMADRAILAPELFDGAEADERADLYMLGQILYMCLAGGHPFGGLTEEEAKKRHFKGLPSLKKYDKYLSKELVKWVSFLTEVKPEDRPGSAVEALRTLPDIPIGAFKKPTLMQQTGAVIDSAQANLLARYARANPTLEDGDASGLAKQATAPVPLTPPGYDESDAGYNDMYQSGYHHYQTRGKLPVGLFLAIGCIVALVSAALFFLFTIVTKKGQSVHEELDVAVEAISEPEVLEEVVNMEGAAPDLSDKATLVDEVLSNEETGVTGDTRIIEESVEIVREDPEPIIIFDGSVKDHDDWEYSWPSKQELVEDGWEINDDSWNSIPGIKYNLSKDSNKMLDRGWSISYKVSPREGAHRVGFFLSEEMNPGWMNGKAISCTLVMKYNENKLSLYTPKDATYSMTDVEVKTVDYVVGESGFITLTIEQQPNVVSGEYVVKLEGEEIFRDTFKQGIEYPRMDKWQNTLYSSALNEPTMPAWVIGELRLDTL